MRRLAIAITILLVLFAPLGGDRSAAATTSGTLGAVEWLRAQQRPDGGFAGTGANSDPSTTADVAVAFAAAGIDPGLVARDGHSVMTYLASQAPEYGKSTAGAAKLTLAVTAAGLDPRSFGGVNLVERISQALDSTTGLYDKQIFVDAYAVLALGAAGEAVPGAAVDALIARQNTDGGWSFTGEQGQGTSDSNTTAVVIQALVAAGAGTASAVDAGIGYLSAAQTTSGSFVYQVAGGPSTAGDANSTALAIQALVAAGQDPASEDWDHALDALHAFQNSSGAFRYQDGQPGDNILATVQALPALEMIPLPVKPGPRFGQASVIERAMQPVSPTEGCAYYEQTRHNLCGNFLRYWLQFGGLGVFGYPITEQFDESGLTVQYFERARMEAHPGASPETYDIILGRLGSEATATRANEAPFQPVGPSDRPECIYVQETQHRLCAGFRAYWEHFGGLAVYGLPISEEFAENGVRVQYFERARFEWHPGQSPSHYDVWLSRLGVTAIEAK